MADEDNKQKFKVEVQCMSCYNNFMITVERLELDANKNVKCQCGTNFAVAFERKNNLWKSCNPK
ncbi:MAG: hypothetical protein GY870_07270 [archaeon]|nr:hypothetical protein [archaeon]